jgi:hypothetical protein
VDDAPHRAPGGRTPRLGDGSAQLAAPACGFAEGELEVSAQTQDVGEAKESLPAPFSGDPLEIGFNPEFLRDGIESVQSDDVRLKLISPAQARADSRRGRRLLVPDHADQARRVGRARA